jgi:hypothetical protein
MPTFKWLFLKNLRSKTLGQIQNLDPHRLMSRLKSMTTPGDTLRNSAILLSTSGSRRWIWMVMADDENSDLAANAAEQKVTRNRRKFALRISRSRIEKVACLWPFARRRQSDS